MTRLLLLAALVGVWGAASSDWLAPGWLRFGLPASLRQPLTTATTYDLGCGVRRSNQGRALSTLADYLPDWVGVDFLDQNACPLQSEMN